MMDLLEDLQIFSSRIQLERFVVILEGLTDYGMYMQALREINTRLEAGKEDFHRISKLEAHRETGLEETERLFTIDGLKRIQRDRLRELRVLIPLAKALKQRVGILTPEKREQFEAEFWLAKMKEKIALSMLFSGSVSPDVYQMLRLLPDSVYSLGDKALSDPAMTTSAYVGERPKLPEIPELESEDSVRGLIEC